MLVMDSLFSLPRQQSAAPTIGIYTPNSSATPDAYIDAVIVNVKPKGWSFFGASNDAEVTVTVLTGNSFNPYLQIELPPDVRDIRWLFSDEQRTELKKQIDGLGITGTVVQADPQNAPGVPQTSNNRLQLVLQPAFLQTDPPPPDGRLLVYGSYAAKFLVHGMYDHSKGLFSGTQRLNIELKQSDSSSKIQPYMFIGQVPEGLGRVTSPAVSSSFDKTQQTRLFASSASTSLEIEPSQHTRLSAYGIVALICMCLMWRYVASLARKLLQAIGRFDLRRYRRVDHWTRVARISLMFTFVIMLLLSVVNLGIPYFFKGQVSDEAAHSQIFIERSDAQTWAGVKFHSVNVQMHPLPGLGPFGLRPDTNGLLLRIVGIAIGEVPIKDVATMRGGAEISPIRLNAILPKSHQNDKLLDDQGVGYLAYTATVKFGIDNKYTVVMPAAESPDVDGRLASIAPAMAMPYFRRDRLTHSQSTQVVFIFGFETDVSDSYVRADGLASATHAITWENLLARKNDDQQQLNQGELVFQACNCGLRAVSPPPTNSFSDFIIWDDLDPQKHAIYEVSTDTWITKIVQFSNYAVIPALVGLILTWSLEKRTKPNG